MTFLTRTALARTASYIRSNSTRSIVVTLRQKSTSSSSSSSSTTTKTTTSSTKPKSPELFDQTVVLSNGATFTLRTSSPRSQLRLTRDTRNHPLWNPELRGTSTGDDSGQLSKFAKKFGDMDGFGDLEFADGGDVDRKSLTAKQVAQATPTTGGKGKGKKK
ncbi:hypothetical protein BGZ94_000057 [Podila epigama]|nr:hypothetical protein BGZ94_000057 [Podila epigama]